jgi:predicted HNH restriction endonuclease
MGDEHKTTLDQLRCLCANCHRIVHHRLKLRQLDSMVDSPNQGAPFSKTVAR